MINNINDLANLYRQMSSDPVRLLSQRFNIPPEVNTQDPNAILQHLLNSGQVSQDQVNRVMGMRNNPVIQTIMGSNRY